MKTIQNVRSRISVTRLAGVAALACACLGLASSVLAADTFVQKHGRLSVKGNQIVDKDGKPTTLHGMSLYCWAQQGYQFFNTSAINHFAQDWKCTAIRIAIKPQDYRSNPKKELDKVKTVMDACIANGIYGIIDWHSMAGAEQRRLVAGVLRGRGHVLREDPQHHVRAVERAGAGVVGRHQEIS